MDCHAFLNQLPTTDEVIHKVNERYDNLFHMDSEGNLRPFVCTICDEFLFSDKEIEHITIDQLCKRRELLLWTSLDPSDRIPAIEDHYKFREPLPDGIDASRLDGMALSPRGSVQKKPGSRKCSFTSCRDSKSSLC